MATLSLSRTSRNSKNSENHVSYPRHHARVGYAFTPVPKLDRRGLNPTHERYLVVVLEFARNGVADPSNRQIAAAMHRSVSTVKTCRRVLEASRLLAVKARRVSHNRNLTNVYTVRGVGSENYPEKPKADVKTTTPRSRSVRPAYSRSVENHHPAFRRLVEYKQRLEAENRGLRAIHRGRDHERRERMTMQAQVGMAHTFRPAPQPTPEEEAEYEAARARMHARAAAERAAEAEKQAQKRREHEEWVRRQRESMNEPLSAAEQEIVDRLNRKLGFGRR
jgi:hypothetical protein